MNDSSLTGLQQWLEKAINYERFLNKAKFSLSSMENLIDKFSNPQRFFNSVHVAGSKGKGSVSQCIASILHEAGFSEGLYSSPHISFFSERVRSAHAVFDEKIYKKSAEELMAGTDTESATWFELVTIFAFLCFKNAKIDWAVFETGIGGRLDATNVIEPDICVITPIELEHTEILGDTIKKIAFEKAGIFKKNIPVCVAPQSKDARAVFEERARELDCPIFFLDDILKTADWKINQTDMDITLDFGNFSLNGKKLFKRYLSARLRLLGGVQSQNASLAALCCKILFPDMDESVIERGLEKAVLPGRFEIIKYKGENTNQITVVLDGAHTVNSVRHTLETLRQIQCDGKIHLLFGCAADKKIDEITPLFFQSLVSFTNITLTPPGTVKKADMTAMTNAFTRFVSSPPAVYENCETAIIDALKTAAKENASLLVTGSFYLVGEVKKILSDF